MIKQNIFLLILIATLMMSCGFSKQSTNCAGSGKLEFICDLSSQMSIQEFDEITFLIKDSVVINKDFKLAENDTRPEFSIYTVTMFNYNHLGLKGNLRTLFFNNELTSVWFYPTDHDLYIKALKENLSIDFTTQKHIYNGCLEIHYIEKSYVGWTDSRLSDKMNKWISKYA